MKNYNKKKWRTGGKVERVIHRMKGYERMLWCITELPAGQMLRGE